MVDVPVETPVKVPEVLMVPTAGLLLTHVPPAIASVNVATPPGHNAADPDIGAGVGVTVIL